MSPDPLRSLKDVLKGSTGGSAVTASQLKAVFAKIDRGGTWTDERLEELIASFPGSGGAEVDLEHFVDWLFAGNGAVSEGEKQKPIFFDMVHSNNAARIRIWMRLKGLQDVIERRVVTYADLQSPEFAAVNPLKKVPAFVNSAGDCIFESYVILEYLEDKYLGLGSVPSFTLPTPEARAYVQLLVRIHDLYIASPNCTQPGFSHTQGSMYLAPYETKFCAASRCMDKPTRAAKLAEIWKQLTWLEEHCKGKYLAGDSITVADMTWYPTTIFMEFMLPRAFGWPEIFKDPVHFPKLASWHQGLTANSIFGEVRQEIWDFWLAKEEEGQFESIKGELTDEGFKWKYP
eukprot:CAMPEP_0197880678 /NCGR_PEP_ID=MMETSP1439-20131203/8398_1 /TAXON_ID=66791 /ORGANISM="Gonyaulax spinifera, Strain CCMP409" /LENGTH=344 /DNA_ID=CAMNT_0043500241 /DNA_START=33 /DNA_END=1067 /DNA_ORIENTATION=+